MPDYLRIAASKECFAYFMQTDPASWGRKIREIERGMLHVEQLRLADAGPVCRDRLLRLVDRPI